MNTSMSAGLIQQRICTVKVMARRKQSKQYLTCARSATEDTIDAKNMAHIPGLPPERRCVSSIGLSDSCNDAIPSGE